MDSPLTHALLTEMVTEAELGQQDQGASISLGVRSERETCSLGPGGAETSQPWAGMAWKTGSLPLG